MTKSSKTSQRATDDDRRQQEVQEFIKRVSPEGLKLVNELCERYGRPPLGAS
jgi:hypothetical protein